MTSYGYASGGLLPWGDMLVNYNGTAITYDNIGNPLNWRNASEFVWSARDLVSVNLSNGNAVSYTYNADGIRTQKVYNNTVHNYTLDGSQIIKEEVSIDSNTSYELYYIYDASGSVIGFRYNNAPYYFLKNLQGDVVSIVNAMGTVVVEYTYDAWGKILSTTGTLASTIGAYNPFRYRAYYYDSETGFYYVFSRYYDPEIGRWISPEPNVDYGEFDEGAGLLGYNVYAYCANNPVMFKDETGESITLTCVLIGAGIGLLAGGGFGAYRASKKGYSPSDGWKYWKYVVGYGVAGGAIGALVGWGAGALIAKYGVATAATSITKGGGARFSTFKALKNSLGSAGKGRHWHHIVEQCQIKTSRAGFSKYWVHNSNNVINITDDVHQLISNFYSSIPNKQVVDTGGKVFRDWLNGMSFEQQYKWGIWVLRYFGVKV